MFHHQSGTSASERGRYRHDGCLGGCWRTNGHRPLGENQARVSGEGVAVAEASSWQGCFPTRVDAAQARGVSSVLCTLAGVAPKPGPSRRQKCQLLSVAPLSR